MHNIAILTVCKLVLLDVYFLCNKFFILDFRTSKFAIILLMFFVLIYLDQEIKKAKQNSCFDRKSLYQHTELSSFPKTLIFMARNWLRGLVAKKTDCEIENQKFPFQMQGCCE